MLARIILTERHVKTDPETGARTPKAEAFLPYKWVELSVIRHRELDETELWEIARGIAELRQKTLIGRGDFAARSARARGLDVVPAEGAGLPKNHADVINWPAEKPAQLLLAAEIASAAEFVAPR